MISQRNKKKIYDGGVSIYHDYWAVAHYAGEPFFEEGVMSYYDGRMVSIFAFPLLEGADIDNGTLRKMVRSWITDRGAEAVLYVGPRPLDLSWLRGSGFRRTAVTPRHPYSSEIHIPCNCAALDHRAKTAYRRSRKRGYISRIVRGDRIRWDHMRIIEKFHQGREVSCYFAELAFAYTAYLQSVRVHIIEARIDGELRGLVALHKPFGKTAVALFLAHDQRAVGISDFLYAEMLDHACHLDVKAVNVGPSPTSGHYNFKLKWGGRPVVPPYYCVTWARGHLAKRNHVAWGPRLVRLRT